MKYVKRKTMNYFFDEHWKLAPPECDITFSNEDIREYLRGEKDLERELWSILEMQRSKWLNEKTVYEERKMFLKHPDQMFEDWVIRLAGTAMVAESMHIETLTAVIDLDGEEVISNIQTAAIPMLLKHIGTSGGWFRVELAADRTRPLMVGPFIALLKDIVLLTDGRLPEYGGKVLYQKNI